MASEFRIHKPYVLATLPRPLHHTGGRIVAREVYAQRDGQKRRRTELVVGVDGETASIYDVPTSRLITSYPIPPQESFSCPPYSIRVRRTGSSEVSRYTFIATKDSASHKITLFKDIVHRDGKTTSTTQYETLRGSPVRYMTSASSASQPSTVGDVIAVCENGEVIGLSGESLAVQWTSPSKSVVQDISPSAIDSFDVEFVASGTVAELSEGIFKSRPEVFTALPKAADSNPTLLILVSRSKSQGQEVRHLLVLAVVSGSKSSATELQRLTPLDVVPIVSDGKIKGAPTYQVDSQSGMLLQLQKGSLAVYDLTGAVPKLKSTIPTEKAESFTRLSRPFVLSCSADSITLYNYQYRSKHANAPLDLSDLPADSQDAQSCQLISYVRSQDLVVALIDNVLVCIQVEPPKSQGKRRKVGLLIDSIGRGASGEVPAKKVKTDKVAVEFSKQLPGTVTATYMAKYAAKLKRADELLSKKQLAAWEEKLRAEFQMRPDASKPKNTSSSGDRSHDETIDWDWTEASSYPKVDRRWIIYAIRQAFSVETNDGEEPQLRLREVAVGDDSAYAANVTNYLTIAGHLTASNLESAFGHKSLASSLVLLITELDPSMTLLHSYLANTNLGETEILLAIRALMLSMDLIAKPKAKKLVPNSDNTNTITANGETDVEAEAEIETDDMMLDRLEEEIALTEAYLGDEHSIRSRTLTLSFNKLFSLPSRSTVTALRTTLSTSEILSLIHLLRVELVQGAWTSLYIDSSSDHQQQQQPFDEPASDGAIVLIADLLGRCVDAVGSGGWLLNDAFTGGDDILSALRLEVSAALKGVMEASTLNGYVSEAMRYVTSFGTSSSSVVAAAAAAAKQQGGSSMQMLPLGLKGKGVVGKDKVVSGGEILQRTSRETGHLISRKVETYSLERLAV